MAEREEAKYLIKHKSTGLTGVMILEQIKVYKNNIIVLKQIKEKVDVVTK